MESKLREALNMTMQPIAVIKTHAIPSGALRYREGAVGGCMIAFLEAAAKGRTAAFTESTCGCPGGRTGLGFAPANRDHLSFFLSAGTENMPGEYYKKTPDLAGEYVDQLPSARPEPVLLLKPLDQVSEDEAPVSIVFLVNADQLSGLVTLANYDRPTGENVRIRFGSGCSQSILYSMCDSEFGSDVCTIGLTDPSSRLHLSPSLLSFSIPWRRFLEMEDNVEESFLTKETWYQLRPRIQ